MRVQPAPCAVTVTSVDIGHQRPADPARSGWAGGESIRDRFAGAPTAVAVLVALSVVVLGTVGGDARWLGVLGRIVASSRHIPRGIPFAEAPTSAWHNVPVLAELLFAGVMTLGGDHGLLLTQAAAATVALLVLARDARREGAADQSVALVLLLVAFGCSTTLLIARLQLFSLVLFPVELALLRAETRRPSWRIWLLIPLLALWSNLHGAALVGLAVAASYLLLQLGRQRPIRAAVVGGAGGLALCLTPALAATPAYYLGVLGNETARQHVGLWAHLTLRSPFDVALLLAACALLPALRRARPRVWEITALLGLAAMTAETSRNGVWLLFAAAIPAADGWRREHSGPVLDSRGLSVAPLVWTAAAAMAFLGCARGLSLADGTPPLVAAAVREAAGGPVAAEGVLSEQVVAAGGRVWLTNPLDAFSDVDQRRYVRWSETGEVQMLPPFSLIVVVRPGSAAAAALDACPLFQRLAADHDAAVFRRASSSVSGCESEVGNGPRAWGAESSHILIDKLSGNLAAAASERRNGPISRLGRGTPLTTMRDTHTRAV